MDGKDQEVPNFYEALGVPRDADPEAIRKAFRQNAKENHPDVNPDPDTQEKFKLITEAWDTLSNPDSRREYDAKFASPSRARTTYEPTTQAASKHSPFTHDFQERPGESSEDRFQRRREETWAKMGVKAEPEEEISEEERIQRRREDVWAKMEKEKKK